MEITKTLSLLAAVFLILTMLMNFLGNPPRIPGDIYIDKPGIKIYIPLTSSLIVSVILSLLFSQILK